MLDDLAVSSRSRRNPRAIKRKMSNWPLRKRGTDGTGKVSLQIDILLTVHPMAKRKPRTKKTCQKDGIGSISVVAGASPTTRSWTARGVDPTPRTIKD